MSQKPSLVLRCVGIVLAVVAMVALVTSLGRQFASNDKPTPAKGIPPMQSPRLEPAHSQTLGRNEGQPASFTNVPDGIKERTLAEFYARRAFPGAPPIVPHETTEHLANCLACHQSGGLVPHMKAFAPKSPHTEYESCTQCHVPQDTSVAAPGTAWVKAKPPELQRSALPGSPPPIPHTLQLRNNCAACHVGASAVREIRTSHPERLNCVQCHVPQE